MQTGITTPEMIIEERISDLESELATLEEFIAEADEAEADAANDDEDDDAANANTDDNAPDPEELEAAQDRIGDITRLLADVQSAVADGNYDEALHELEFEA